MDMNTYMGNVTLGWLVSSLALVLEHVYCWNQPWRLSEPWNYAVGVLTILGGCAVWAWRQSGTVEPWLACIAFSIIAVGSGAWVVLAYAIRGRLALWKMRDETLKQRKHEVADTLNDTLDNLRRN